MNPIQKEKIAEKVLDELMEKFSGGKLDWEKTKAFLRQINSQIKSDQQGQSQITEMFIMGVKLAIAETILAYEPEVKQYKQFEEDLTKEKKAQNRMNDELRHKAAQLEARNKEIGLLKEEVYNTKAKSYRLFALFQLLKDDAWLKWLIETHEENPESFREDERENIRILKERIEQIEEVLK